MFKTGDRVRIKSSYALPRMQAYIGKEATVCKKCVYDSYILDIDNVGWHWNESMLEKVEGCDYRNKMEYMKLREGVLPNYCYMCGRKLK